ncbi:type II toxin-antitoxin system RelE/ParE family toxin [Serratia bockelmannii]|uniref:type II toxin-antitoxin system RelE/ParE family toxin n=1 Tax=Serratia bockelmannii TaxID=2703793 RepID=UPI0011F2B8B8|nr:type II toxin-antitoxin system RelE/ParE family toxin [Serratia bockelmannii]
MAKGNVAFIYSSTAKMTMQTIAHFLRSRQLDPKPVIANVLDEFEEKTGLFPEGSPVCQELLELGCAKYRECNTANGYRVLYSTRQNEKDGVIYVHAVLSQKQHIASLLFNRILEWQ